MRDDARNELPGAQEDANAASEIHLFPDEDQNRRPPPEEAHERLEYEKAILAGTSRRVILALLEEAYEERGFYLGEAVALRYFVPQVVDNGAAFVRPMRGLGPVLGTLVGAGYRVPTVSQIAEVLAPQGLDSPFGIVLAREVARVLGRAVNIGDAATVRRLRPALEFVVRVAGGPSYPAEREMAGEGRRGLGREARAAAKIGDLFCGSLEPMLYKYPLLQSYEVAGLAAESADAGRLRGVEEKRVYDATKAYLELLGRVGLCPFRRHGLGRDLQDCLSSPPEGRVASSAVLAVLEVVPLEETGIERDFWLQVVENVRMYSALDDRDGLAARTLRVLRGGARVPVLG